MQLPVESSSEVSEDKEAKKETKEQESERQDGEGVVEKNTDAGPSSGDVGTNGQEKSEQGGAGVEEEEEETDLKLAWEVLELARVLCQRYIHTHHTLYCI